jgi:hypothetical protein
MSTRAHNEAAPEAGPLFFLCFSCAGGLSRTLRTLSLLYVPFFLFFAFFFMMLFLGVEPLPNRKHGIGQMNPA